MHPSGREAKLAAHHSSTLQCRCQRSRYHRKAHALNKCIQIHKRVWCGSGIWQVTQSCGVHTSGGCGGVACGLLSAAAHGYNAHKSSAAQVGDKHGMAARRMRRHLVLFDAHTALLLCKPSMKLNLKHSTCSITHAWETAGVLACAWYKQLQDVPRTEGTAK